MEGMDMMEDTIKGVLPFLEDASLNAILQHLSTMGVRTPEDLDFINDADLCHILPVVDCRKLIRAFKKAAHGDTQPRPDASEEITLTLLPCTDTAPNSEPLLAASTSPVPVQHSTWVSTFVVPWEKMRPSLRRCLAEKKRPKREDRLHMVRVIADDIKQVCLNPPLRQCVELAKTMVEIYPESLEDRTEEGEPMGSGYFCLGKQLRERMQFLNRDNTLARLRKPKRLAPPVEDDHPGPSKCAKTDSYGCVNWQPLQLPEGENRESLSEKKRELLTIYSLEGQRAADQKRVDDLMTVTYEPQRRDLNATPSPTMSELQKEWPFLFMQKFLLKHFCSLTGFDLESRLQESLARKGARVLKYFESQLLRWKKDVKMVLSCLERQEEEVDPGLAAILVMVTHFQEKEDALFLLADETSTQADIEAQLSLPSTPRLIMLGHSILGARKWMLSTEGGVILRLSETSSFTTALAVLFASYYVFNIEYPAEAATSLEFIQRFFVRINPEYSKCKAKTQVSRRTGKMVQRKSESLNPHVASFIRDFIDYDWKN